ncbi:hypothetical protein Ddye_007592 [Dipteronia dyeriana]|uniref:Uncharacterized protein n=1 Tax=Dipteronia dyeriana TaxID=168575 RepID=A0AAE0CRT9_9ROSI|nr:hypothetical protein Ddye_007592 [Dipteronia dyeriana]
MSLFGLSHGDVGTAAQYTPPYLRKIRACHCLLWKLSHPIPTRLPVWGSQRLGMGREAVQVRCISAAVPNTCIPGATVLIRIIDRAETSVSRPSRNGATIVLSTTAFSTIANSSANLINIEFSK